MTTATGLTTRQKVARLKKAGFAKARVQLSRMGLTYDNGPVSVTIGKNSSNFIVSGSLTYSSALLFIGNTADKAKAELRVLRELGHRLPDPDSEDFGSPDWMAELFEATLDLIKLALDGEERG